MLNNVEFVSMKTSPAGKTKKVDIEFKHLSGKFAGDTWTKGNLVPNLDAESLATLKAATQGSQIALEISKNDKGFYNVTQVRPAGTVSAKSAPSRTESRPSAQSNTVGIKVGAARNQAIAFLSATKGKSFSLDDVDAIAYEIVERQAAQEKNVAAGNNPCARREQTQSADVSEDALDSDSIPF